MVNPQSPPPSVAKKSMNVLLLYPRFPDTFWSFKHALKFIHKRASLAPLGLLTVAAMLPAPWAKRLVDVNVRKLREKGLAWADLVFVSGMIAQRDLARELFARCRAAGETIVSGGPLFPVQHEQFALWPPASPPSLCSQARSRPLKQRIRGHRIQETHPEGKAKLG
jgi:hypothetical protein